MSLKSLNRNLLLWIIRIKVSNVPKCLKYFLKNNVLFLLLYIQLKKHRVQRNYYWQCDAKQSPVYFSELYCLIVKCKKIIISNALIKEK